MECAVEGEGIDSVNKTDYGEEESSENFQKFIHVLFEQNGVLNDLRAYLRGHIVNVLKSAQTGDPLMCQKHFTKRLEFTNQALNILIVEYLIRMEFNYSLSVFISEIPLSNMVFQFARNFIKTDNSGIATLFFGESDVWSVLKHLGIKCDSEHASKIFDMYSKRNSSLLSCILNCIQLYNDAPNSEKAYSSDDTVSSLTTDTHEDNSKTKQKYINKCKHYAYCKACQNRVKNIKETYEKKKIKFEKNLKETHIKDKNLNNFMKTVSIMEQSLIDEMFHQLKSVYESEVEMIKGEEERRVKRLVATHAIELEKHKEHLEESFRNKEAKLEENIRQKKKFLWGLARALRDQHESMAKAMMDVKFETERLVEKEENLKKQIEEAEKILKNKGENMRTQISQELKILAGHLEAMKKERDVIDRERTEIDNLKQIYDKNEIILKEHKENKSELINHYELLKEELKVLKKCIENNKIESKCLKEKSTATDLDVKNMMNNEMNIRSEDKIKVQVVNDFKKQNNINFNQSEICQQQLIGSRASLNGIVEENMQMLKQENERLKALAAQQRERLQSLLTPPPRPLAPFMSHTYLTDYRTSGQASACFNRACGEQLHLYPHMEARVLRPGDPIPFIGAPPDTKHTHRRHLINQWRALQRRLSATKARPTQNQSREVIDKPKPTISNAAVIETNTYENEQLENVKEPIVNNTTSHADPSPITQPMPRVSMSNKTVRDRSPKSVIKEAKQKLRNNNIKENSPIRREKSPNAMLKEAKLRLRKLEIEAEAVEQSYANFKRKRELSIGKIVVEESKIETNEQAYAEFRKPRDLYIGKTDVSHNSNAIKLDSEKIDIQPGNGANKLNENYNIDNTPYTALPETMKKDFDRYLREYQTKYDISNNKLPNKNAIIDKVKPIPKNYTTCNEDDQKLNYLETPLSEFRKLYQKEKSEKVVVYGNMDDNLNIRHKDYKSELNSKKAEFKILKDNISKIYNIPKSNLSEAKLDSAESENAVPISQEVIDVNNKNIEIPNVEINKISEEPKKDSENDLILLKSSEIFELDEETDVKEDKKEKYLNEIEEIPNNKNENTSDNENKENILIVEVENIHEENNIQVTDSKDLLVIVESSIDNSDIATPISPQMTVIISPRHKSKELSNPNEIDKLKFDSEMLPKDNFKDALIKDVAEIVSYNEDLTKNITNLESSKNSSNELSRENSSELERNYLDDFSADVDNYNTQSDNGKNSPISLAKTEDDNFWDS